jgi:integrase
MPRTGENIYRRKDGRWEARYIKGRKEDGKPRYGYVYARKYAEAKAKALPFRYQYAVSPEPSFGYKGTFADFARAWLADVSQSPVKPLKASTLAFYSTLLRTRLLPAFGERRLEGITREDVSAFLESLLQTGMGTNSALNALGLRNRICKAAAAGNALPANPCGGVTLPRRETVRVPALRVKEQKRLEREALRDRDGLPVLLALYTGMRIGEICALRWEDVDFENGLIHVRHTLQRIAAEGKKNKTALVFGAPKSACSGRDIPLSPSLKTLLREAWKKRAGGYVVSRKSGCAEPRTVRYWFRRIARRAGLSSVRFHTLRHTFATRCVELGVDIATLSRLLGHSSVKMTLDIYAGSTPEQQAAAVRKLDRLRLPAAV